ncbi:MAG: MmgE/PrpD family protein [bacterium]
MCETHGKVSCQAAIQVVPGALAVAERAGRNGRELLEALVTGYDVAIRLGAATTRRPLAHPLGQAGMLGAIAAGARLRGLDAAGVVSRPAAREHGGTTAGSRRQAGAQPGHLGLFRSAEDHPDRVEQHQSRQPLHPGGDIVPVRFRRHAGQRFDRLAHRRFLQSKP